VWVQCCSSKVTGLIWPMAECLSAAVVAVLDPGSDGEFGAGLGGPDAAVVELGLQRREERFGHRVIPRRQLRLIPMIGVGLFG